MLGIEQWIKEAKEKGDYIRMLKINAGEVATMRFLLDYPNMKAAYFHVKTQFSPQAGRNIFRNILCTKESDGQCPLCDAGLAADALKIHGWVWVYNILSATPSVPEAEPVTRGNRTLYKIPVNALRLFRYGPGKSRYIVNSLKSYYVKYGSLTDRDYEWQREGATKEDTTYSLLPNDKSDFTVDLSSVVVPELEAYIRKAFTDGTNQNANPAEGNPQRLLDRLQKAANPENIGEPI